MLQRLAPLGALALLPLAAPFALLPWDGPEVPVDGIDAGREIASFLPERSLVYVEASGLDPILEQGLEHPFLRRLLASEFGQALLGESAVSPETLLAIGQLMIGRPVLSTLGTLISRGAALGVIPGEGDEASFVLVLHGEDTGLLAEVLDLAFDAVEEKYDADGLLDTPERRLLGAEVWNLGEDLVVAKREGLLVASNERGYAREVLELAADTDGKGLLAIESFREHKDQIQGDEALFAWTDLDRIAEVDPTKIEELARINLDAGALGILGPGIAGMGTSQAVTAWLSIDDTGGGVELGLRGSDAKPAEVLLPSEDTFGRPVALPVTSEDVAHGLVYRDYASFVRERVDLVPAETLPGFSQGLSTLSLFFGGQDFGEDVLPGLSPWIQIISRDLHYDEGLVPENPLPGLALVASLRDPERDGAEWVTAFQTLVGILNADRAQKQGGMMRLRLGLEGATEITSAGYLPPGPGDGVDISYNLQPACAVVGDSLVLGTHEDLVRSVVRQLQHQEEDRSTSHSDLFVEHLELSGAAAARALRDNFETLVMQKVLDEGVTIEEAEEELGGLLLLLASIEDARVEVAYGDLLQMQVQLTFVDEEQGE